MGLILNLQPDVLYYRLLYYRPHEQMYFAGMSERMECYIKTGWEASFNIMGLPSMLQIIAQEIDITVESSGRLRTYQTLDVKWFHPALSLVQYRAELLPYYLSVVREWEAAVDWGGLTESGRIGLMREFEISVVRERIEYCVGRKFRIVREVVG